MIAGAGTSAPGLSIGNACALHFAREGARVFAVDVNIEAAHDICRRIADEGHHAIPFKAELSNPADVNQMVSACVSAYGKIDVLQFNAGHNVSGGPLDLAEEDWNRVIAVNGTGYYLALKACLPVMLSQGKGSIVAVSSVAAIRYPGLPHFAYGATKAAMHQMTKYVALEYVRQGIRANTLVPGMVDTPRISRLASSYSRDGFAGARKERDRLCPMGRTATPWEIAHAAAFLASDNASYITGTELVVDGGLTSQFAMSAKT